MSGGLSDEVLPLQLRKLDESVKGDIFKTLIYKILGDFVKLHIRHQFGEIKKAGIFAAYAEDGELVIYFLAQEVSKRGYMAITGRYFFLPNKPDNVFELSNLFPPVINALFASPRFEYYLYRNIIPSIIDVAIDRLYPIRTNAYELEGCYQYKIPVLGFILHKNIKDSPKAKCHNNKCKKLTINKKVGVECKAEDESQCEDGMPQQYCPFYDVLNIPWSQKIWFLTSEQWKLIGINKIEKIVTYLDDFLR